MTLKNTYKYITRAMIAVFAMPVVVMAAGIPTITLDGVTEVNEHTATVVVSYDSGGNDYSFFREAPTVFVEYTNTKTDEKLLSAYSSQSMAFRTNSFGLYDLEKDTTYSYRGVLKYEGETVYTSKKTFTTKGKVVPKTTTTITSTNTIGTIPGTTVVTDLGSKIVADAKSKVMTGGATHKNGVAIGITNEQARTAARDTFTYTVTYQNTNKESLKNAELVIELPEQYEFVTSSLDMDYNERDNTVTYNIGRVASQVIKSVTFTARAIGDGNGEIRTTATLVYEGGSISASDRDSYQGGSKSVLGASVFGAGFFPQTLGGWLAIIILIALIIIVARRYTTAPVVQPQPQPQKTA
jgi:hypothetical protein